METFSGRYTGHPQEVIFQRTKDVGRRHSQDIGMGRPLMLHRGSYGDIHRTSFEDVHLPSGKGLCISPNILIYLVNQGDAVCWGSKFKYLLKFYEEHFVQVSMKTLEAE